MLLDKVSDAYFLLNPPIPSSAEKKMYTLLKDILPTYISVGHRPTLISHHDFKLSLREGLGHISEIPPGSSVADEGFILT